MQEQKDQKDDDKLLKELKEALADEVPKEVKDKAKEAFKKRK